MADQDQAVDTDYSGRPTEEIVEDPFPLYCPYDVGADLPDGRSAVLTVGGRYYVAKDDGWPDWDQPVHIRGLSPEPPRAGDQVVQ